MIPKTFDLVNREWKVRLVTAKQFQKHLDHHENCNEPPGEEITAKGLKGWCDPDLRRIFINKSEHHTEEDLQHTYFHELTHALKFANGEDDHDEVEVDRFGGFLHQYERTKKG